MEMSVIQGRTESCATARKDGEASTVMVSQHCLVLALANQQSARMTMLVLLSRRGSQRATVPAPKAMRRMIWCATRVDWLSKGTGKCVMSQVSSVLT